MRVVRDEERGENSYESRRKISLSRHASRKFSNSMNRKTEDRGKISIMIMIEFFARFEELGCG
jgi:hypothetical protein